MAVFRRPPTSADALPPSAQAVLRQFGAGLPATDPTNPGVGAVDPRALIKEARLRQRRRRRRGAAVALVVVVAGALGFGIVRLVSGGSARVAGDTPKGLFVDRSAFAGHGVLAFVSRGGLFVLDGRSQKLTPITRPGGKASDPRFSPNGSWLAYTIGTGGLGLARSDGSSARVISRHEGGAAWLPNGDLLMSNGVFRLDANARLVRVGAAPAGSITWSPDGDRFAFVSRAIVHERQCASVARRQRPSVAAHCRSCVGFPVLCSDSVMPRSPGAS
jgi:WD40-like Beta Propeller Repeat